MHMIYDKAKQKWLIYRRVIPEVSERLIADESDREPTWGTPWKCLSHPPISSSVGKSAAGKDVCLRNRWTSMLE